MGASEQATGAEAAPLSAAALYARALPLLTLALLVWYVLTDSVLEYEGPEHGATAVTWGLRTLSSRAGPDQTDALGHTYAEAADKIRDHLAQDPASPGLPPARREEAVDTEAAYRSLHERGWLALAVLGIAGVFLLAGALLRGLGILERVRFLLLGVGTSVAGVLWFRWCFGTVASAIAYAADGDYGFTSTTGLLFFGLIAAAVVGLGLWLADRRGAAAEAQRRSA